MTIYKAARRTPPPTCGPITFRRIEKVPAADWEGRFSQQFEIQALMGGRPAGYLNARLRQLGRVGYVLVAETIEIRTPPRCGLGTKIYEQALQLACEKNARLASDVARSDAAEGFWRKQVRKGRARCYRRTAPGIKVAYDYEQRRFAETDEKWSCNRYLMREACPPEMSLKGRRR
jgi:hypothetical protein